MYFYNSSLELLCLFHCCGFYGKFGCSVELNKTTHGTLIPGSNCKLVKKFSLKSSEKPNKRNPCSNRPFECEICQVVYWSYALPTHYTEQHPEQSSCPIVVSDDEKTWMEKMK